MFSNGLTSQSQHCFCQSQSARKTCRFPGRQRVLFFCLKRLMYVALKGGHASTHEGKTSIKRVSFVMAEFFVSH
jgi:hypothetical protein